MYQSAPFLLLSSLCLAVSLLGGPVWCVTTADNPGIRTVFTAKAVEYCKANCIIILCPLIDFCTVWTSICSLFF